MNFIRENLIKLRNLINLRPVYLNKYTDQGSSISDSFVFRNNVNFETIFRFSDLPKLMDGNDSSEVEIQIFDLDNNFICEHVVQNINKSNEINISKILEKKNISIEDGIFYIFHKTNQKNTSKNIFSNRCYVGFSFKNSLYSFVHGNGYVKSRKMDQKIYNVNIYKSSILCKHRFKIQNNYKDFDKVELVFNNPFTDNLKLKIFGKKHIIKSGCTKILQKKNIEVIEFTSNCYHLRPIVFTYKQKYFDVHHA